MRSRSVLALAAGLLLIVCVAFSQDFPMRSGTLNAAAMGTVHAKVDKNGNLAITLDAKHLAPADRLAPAHSNYVVWIQATDKQPEEVGVLSVDPTKETATISTTVPYHQFDIFVTAEDNPKPTSPSSDEALRGVVQK